MLPAIMGGWSVPVGEEAGSVGGTEVVEVARRIGAEVLFPAAMAVEQADAVPVAQLDLLAEAGLYGVAGPIEAGGADLGLPTFCAVVEALAGGCLATTFVWVQHHGLVHQLAAGGPATLRAEWLGPLCRGERRAGLALTGAMPGPARLRARPGDGGGWVLDGTAPWVTGWGRIDVVYLVARGPDDTLVSLLLDAAERPGLVARRQRLVAVDASATVELRFVDVPVGADRVIAVEPFEPPGPAALRINGSLALGVAGRCCRLIGASRLDDQLADRRRLLDEALGDETGELMPAARAAASELAVRAAAALAVHAGSRSILLDQHAQRLTREATFLLVFGSRPQIRAALLDRLTR